MKKTYSLFKKFIPIIMSELALLSIFAILSFQLYYNNEVCSLNFKNIIPILFLSLIFITMATAIYFSFSAKNIKITRIRKNDGFFKFSSIFAAVIVFAIFVYRFIQIVSYPEEAFFPKVAQFLLCIPLCAYFIINIIPKKIRKKTVNIPKNLRYVLSVCTVLWAIFGIFSMYFYNQEYFFTTNIFKIAQILIYAVFAAFFLFEAKTEYFTSNYRMYLLTSILAITLTVSFSASAVIAKLTGAVPQNQSLSEVEMICALSIGIYALSRFFAVFKTMRYVIKEKSESTSTRHHHSHHSLDNSATLDKTQEQ